MDKLDKVSMNTARPTYTVMAFVGAGEDVVAWLANFERYARLQNLVGNQCADAFAFHVAGIAETWYATLPASLQTEWPALKEACRQRFAVETKHDSDNKSQAADNLANTTDSPNNSQNDSAVSEDTASRAPCHPDKGDYQHTIESVLCS